MTATGTSPDDRFLSVSAEASDLQILRAFEPVVCFTKGERFFPAEVEGYVSRAGLWIHNPDGTEAAIVGAGDLDIDRLSRPREYPFRTIEFLRFIDNLGITDSARILSDARRLHREADNRFSPGMGRLARGGFAPRIVDALFSLSFLLRGNVPRLTAAAAELEYRTMLQKNERYVYYGRVVRQAGWTVLQYWFFYYYNGWRSGYSGVNDHESDWENILLYLYEKDGLLYPEWAAYASHDFHGDDLRRRWDDREQLQLIDGHPVVWAGAGSHASYFRPGEYQAVVAIPAPRWVRAVARSLDRFWNLFREREYRPRDPFRIPFVDYARGDGKRIGPGQELSWDPVLIDQSTPWVAGYRGLWGLYARDPISGENAPAGPMYDRDGSPRRSWYDPLGFAGLDAEPPASIAVEVIRRDISDLENAKERLAKEIDLKTSEVQALGAVMISMEGNPHLRARHEEVTEKVAILRAQLSQLRKDYSEDEAVLTALKRKLARVRQGIRDDPRAHIHSLAEPVPVREMRFNRTAEAWGAISLSVILLAIVALLVFARSRLWMGLLVMAVGLVLVESVLRGHYGRTISNIAAFLAAFSTILIFIHYWLWLLVIVLVALAVFLLFQKLRELRS